MPQLGQSTINYLFGNEGSVLTRYYDVNGYSIGHGWHITANGVDTKCKVTPNFPQGLRRYWRGKDLVNQSLLPGEDSQLFFDGADAGGFTAQMTKIKVAISQEQYDALFSLCWNLGSLPNDVVTAINSSPAGNVFDNDSNIRLAWKKHNTVKGSFNSGLNARRLKELDKFFGDSQSPGSNVDGGIQSQALEFQNESVKYIDLNPFLKEIDTNLKSIEKGYLNMSWGQKQQGEKYDWVGLKQYIMYLSHRFMPGGIVPFFELIPTYQLEKSNLNQAQEDLRKNADKVVDEVMQKYVGTFDSEQFLQGNRKVQQVLEKVPGYNETRYNNQVAQFNKLSNKNDIFTLDPWKQEFDSLYNLNDNGKKAWKKKNVGLRVYGQIVLSPEANDDELTKAGEIGFEEIRINMGNTSTKGLSLIELKLKDVQGNKFTDINSPWSFLFDARPGTSTADFLFRYGWSIKVPPKDKSNPLSNLFWEHEGWKLFPDIVKDQFQTITSCDGYFLLTQSLDFDDYLWEKRNNDGSVNVGITGDEENAYMKLSLLNPKIEIDSSGCATATIQFRTGAGLTRNCPLNLAYACQNMVALYPNGVTLTGLIIAVDTDLKNNSTLVDEPGIAKKKQEENISDSKAKTNGSRDLTGIAKVIGAVDYGDNEDDQTINPDSIIINFPQNLIQQIQNLQSDSTLWSWFSDLLTANECALLNFMNGGGLTTTENYIITTTQPNAEAKNNTNKKVNPTSMKDILIQDKDVLAYKHDASLIENINFQSNEKPNQFTIALNYRLGLRLNFNNMASTSTENNNDANKLHVLDRKTNIINMFSQMMEVSIDTICLPWVTPGRKVYIKGTGFNDGNYSCLEVTHTIDSSNKFMSNIRGVRIIPPGDKELEKSLSSPELFDSSLSTTASRLSTTGNGTPLLNNQTTGNYMDRFKLNLPFENKLLKPATGRISSKFGYRNHPIYGTRKLHKGVDIACGVGTNVIAPTNGIITLAQFSQTAGNWMHLQHDDGQKSVFMHLSQFNKKVGDRVNKGELIALSGNTGASKGPHLHYEIYDAEGNPNDPEPFWT